LLDIYYQQEIDKKISIKGVRDVPKQIVIEPIGVVWSGAGNNIYIQFLDIIS